MKFVYTTGSDAVALRGRGITVLTDMFTIWYFWNPSRHKFQYIGSNESRERLDSGEDSLDLPRHSAIEIFSRTRAEWFPEAADGG